MVSFRNSQESIEVLKDGVAPNFRTSQESIEVLKNGYTPFFHLSQESIEVLKSFVVPALVCTIETASGTYLTSVIIKISVDVRGATIYYTTDGSTPDEWSNIYDGGVPMFTGTLSAYAVIDGYADSPVVTADYVAKIPKPDIDPPSGIYTIDGSTIEISSSVLGATIYYTTDGTAPTESSQVYSAAIPMFIGTLRALAVADDYADSEIATAVYYDGLSWPANLPAPLWPVSVQAGSNISRVEWQKGRADVRRFGAGAPDRVKVQLRLKHSQIQTFEAWYNSIVNFGSDWFSADWLDRIGYPDHRARILGHPNIKGSNSVCADYSITLLVQAEDLVIDDITTW